MTHGLRLKDNKKLVSHFLSHLLSLRTELMVFLTTSMALNLTASLAFPPRGVSLAPVGPDFLDPVYPLVSPLISVLDAQQDPIFSSL